MAIHIPVNNTIISPSREFISHLSNLQMIAALAKTLNLVDLYNQVKDAHDNLVCQYNAQSKPKKKGFWEQFKDNLTMNMDTHTAVSVSYLEDDSFFKQWCEYFKKRPQHELVKLLKESIATSNGSNRKSNLEQIFY